MRAWSYPLCRKRSIRNATEGVPYGTAGGHPGGWSRVVSAGTFFTNEPSGRGTTTVAAVGLAAYDT